MYVLIDITPRTASPDLALLSGCAVNFLLHNIKGLLERRGIGAMGHTKL